jgi:hypothetical protein
VQHNRHRTRLGACIIIVVRSGYRGARRVRAAMQGPRVQRALRHLASLLGGEGEGAGTLAVYVVVAAASAGALTIASACAGLGTSELLKVAAALTVGALAASAAIVLVRRRSGPSQRISMRSLVVSTAANIGARYRSVPGSRALQWACDPRALLALATSARPALQYVTTKACSSLISYPAQRFIPVLGPALDMLGAYKTSLDSARFVRHFALTALELSSAATFDRGAPPASRAAA